jgi:hypothetical protein
MLKYPRNNPWSRKFERGRPVTWTTEDRMGRYYRSSNTNHINDNQKLECSAPTCDNQRSDRSHYCLRHARRLRDAGDPVCRLPRRAEIERLQRALQSHLEGIPEDVKYELDMATKTAIKQKLAKPIGWAAGYRGIHGKMPIKGKAAIVLANLVKHDVDLGILITRAVVLHGWAKTRYNGMPQNRTRFLETQTGKLAIRKAKLAIPRRQIDLTTRDESLVWKNLSGTVARQVGEWVISAATEGYGGIAGDLKGLWETIDLDCR